MHVSSHLVVVTAPLAFNAQSIKLQIRKSVKREYENGFAGSGKRALLHYWTSISLQNR
jgi:hypothetical protein